VQLTEADVVVGRENSAINALVVHKRAAGGLQVNELIVAILLAHEFRMKGGDEGILDDDFVARAPSQGKPCLYEIKDKLVAVIEVESQKRHALPSGFLPEEENEA
jgi:hypothetical protein